MTTTTPRERHLDEGHLVRLMDGELDTPAETESRAHLDRCPECAARLHRLEERTTRLDALLDRSGSVLEAPTPAVRPAAGPAGGPRHASQRETARAAGVGSLALGGRAWLRAAVVATVLAAGALLAPPVRAWVADRVEAVAARLSGRAGSDGPAAPDPAGTRDAAPATTLRFRPRFTTLVVHGGGAAPDAVLELRRGTGEDAVLELRASGADVVVLPEGVRIAGGARGARYRLTVPAAVRQVVVRGGAEPVRVDPPPRPDSPAVDVPLEPDR